MKFKLPKFSVYHKIAAATILAAIVLNGLYFYAHILVRDKFVQKMQSKGIVAEVGDVELNLKSVVLSDISLKVKSSETKIESISTPYTFDDIKILKANVQGSAEDYLSLKGGSKSSGGSKPSDRVFTFKESSADLSLRGHKVKASGVSLSSKDYIIRAHQVSLDNMSFNAASFDLNTNKANAMLLTIHRSKAAKASGPIKTKELELPTIPDTTLSVDIQEVVAPIFEDGYEARASNVRVSFKKDDDFFLNIHSENVEYRVKDSNTVDSKRGFFTFKSGDLNISGRPKSFKIMASLIEPDIWIDSIQEGMFGFDTIVFSSEIDGVPSNTRVKNASLIVNGIEMLGSLSMRGREIDKFKIIMPRDECSKVIKALPRSWRHIFEDENYKKAKYSGIIEWSFSGTLEDPKAGIYSTCKFSGVPDILKKSRFKKPFVISFQKERMTGPGTKSWVPLNMSSLYLERALLATEDGAFHRHNGFNTSSIAEVLSEALQGKATRGASTITMQLAKNIWLSPERTLSRKVEEALLTLYLEQTFTKEEILELYINVIEFGPGVYGIYDASQYYFKTSPMELTLKQALFLASILPNPKANYFNGNKLSSGRDKKLNYILQIMLSKGLIDEEEYKEAKKEIVFKR